MAESHLQASQALASGIHAVPDAQTSFAATQAAYRFLNNDRVTLRALAKPLIDAARSDAATVCDTWALVVHDWSQLMYPQHASKQDRIKLSSRGVPEGYELQTALLVSDRQGSPLAPLAMSLRAADGVHCTRSGRVRPALSPLDEIGPVMDYTAQLSLGKPLVHIIDAEADSVDHFRQWSSHPECFYLVRADDRLVEYEAVEQKCSAILSRLHEQAAFTFSRDVEYRGRPGRQYVAEVDVRLLRAGQRNRPQAGDRQRIPGTPLSLRLVLAEIRSPEGDVLAVWRLLTNVPATVAPSTVALWYYWRWQIEQYFKLLKSAGMHVEQWQQTTAHAITARLLVASMACVTVWRLARSTDPAAAEARRLLVRLSGRQMKRSRPITMPALLAGMWTLLAMLEVLNNYSTEQIRQLATIVFGNTRPP